MNKGQNARRFAEWTERLAEDVELTFALTADAKVAQPGRRVLAGALSYILTQLDLIPDHEKVGSVDDAFVLRVAHGLAAEHTAHVGRAESAKIAKLTHEEDELREFLGDALFSKLRRHVLELPEKAVRGRTVDQVLNDARARQDMKRELDQRVKAMKAMHVDDDAAGEAIEVSVKSYLSMKLK
jgi:uncharacterized membrane protein YkvA (DUF1232 family)